MNAEKLAKAIQQLNKKLKELREWEALGFIGQGYKLIKQRDAINQAGKSAEVRKWYAQPQELTPYVTTYLQECTAYNKKREEQAQAPRWERAEEARRQLKELTGRIQKINDAENSGALSKSKAYRLRLANCIASELDPWDLDPKGTEWQQFRQLMEAITKEKKEREN